MFVDGGRVLITYGGKGGLSWRAVATGTEVRSLDFPELSRGLAAAELSPDGRFLAVLGVQMHTVQLVEVGTGRRVGPTLEHDNTVFGAAFSPDGRSLLTSSTGNTVRLWTVPGGKPLARPLDLHRPVQLVAFAPDGRSLATRDGDLVRLWALPGDGVPITRVPVGASSFAAISPDGSLAIPTGLSITWGGIRFDAGLSRRDGRAGRPAAPLRSPDHRRDLLARRAIGCHRWRRRR